MAKIEVTGFCWLWTGTLVNGYGRRRIDGYGKQAHRLVYEMLVGPLGDLNADHLCRVRNCVNPDHIDPITHKENVRRGYGIPGMNLRKTECHKGHPYTEENTVWDKKGGRKCRICRDANMATWRAINRPPAPPPTHCKHGHEFTPENTWVSPNKKSSARACKTCHRERTQARRAAEKMEALNA